MEHPTENNTISLDENDFADALNACNAVGYTGGYKAGYKAALEKVKSILLKNALGGVDIEE